MESGPTDQVFASPGHPYTMGLLQAVPRLDRDDEALRTIPGDPPNMLNLPRGCPFAPRCSQVMDRCVSTQPQLVASGPARLRACHLEEAAVA